MANPTAPTTAHAGSGNHVRQTSGVGNSVTEGSAREEKTESPAFEKREDAGK